MDVDVVKGLADHFTPKNQKTFAFWKIDQAGILDCESMKDYTRRLRNLNEQCELDEEATNNMVVYKLLKSCDDD